MSANAADAPHPLINPENPENPENEEYINPEFNTLIIPPKQVADCLKIFSISTGYSDTQPSLSTILLSGHHASTIVHSQFDQTTSDTVKATLMHRVWNRQNTDCDIFNRFSNSEGVAQLAYETLIEKIVEYFIHNRYDDQKSVEEILIGLNESINKGRDTCVRSLSKCLEKARELFHRDHSPVNKETYIKFINLITDFYRTDVLSSVGSTFPVGDLASIHHKSKVDVYVSTESRVTTPEVRQAAFNLLLNLKFYTGQSYWSIRFDFDRSALDAIQAREMDNGREMTSYWLGQFFEFTTKKEFIDLVISKLDEAVAGEAKSAYVALKSLWEQRTQAKQSEMWLRWEHAIITLGCKGPELLFPNPAAQPSDSDKLQIIRLPRQRDAYDGVIGKESDNPQYGYTGYFFIPPVFYVPFLSRQCRRVKLYFPSGISDGFNFPIYNHTRVDQAIGSHTGKDEFDSLHFEDSSRSPSLEQQLTSTSKSPPLQLLAQPTAAVNSPPVNVVVPNTQSFFKTILGMCASFLKFIRLDNEQQDVTIFIDRNFDMNKLWIKLLLDIANQDAAAADAAADGPHFFAAAALHSSNAAYELAHLLNEVVISKQDKTIVTQACELALLAADAARLAAASKNHETAKKCVHIAAFSARIVACVYARAISAAAPTSDFNTLFHQIIDCMRIIHSAIATDSFDRIIIKILFKYNNHIVGVAARALGLPWIETDPNHQANHQRADDLVCTLVCNDVLSLEERNQIKTEINDIQQLLSARPLDPRHDNSVKRPRSPTTADATAHATAATPSHGGLLRSRRYLHRVSSKRRRTSKKKNISRKYFKHSSSGCGGTRRRSRRRCRRNCYSRKITTKM